MAQLRINSRNGPVGSGIAESGSGVAESMR
jgi:hypothetical protein